MSPAKVTLSPNELELVNNADWILTKNTVIGKVYTLFGDLSEMYRAELNKHPVFILPEADFRSPKISKGEQYEGLPWVMLDHPRHFSATDIFAVRSFFWWGRFCSITLHLSGKFQERYAGSIQKYFADAGKCKDWYIGSGTDQWQHHFREDNYLPLEKRQERFSALPFLKIAKKIPLREWDLLPIFFEENYRDILSMLAV
jgi:hypothetical protein